MVHSGCCAIGNATGRSATIRNAPRQESALDTIAGRDGGFASALERPTVAYRRVWRRMRVTCLHGGWLASQPEALRDDLIAALTPAQARALLYEWLFWARPNQLPPDGTGGCGCFLPAVDSAKREQARR